MRDNWMNAMNEISDRHIAEAAEPPRKNRIVFRLGAMAAALALVMLAAFTAMDPGGDAATDPTDLRLQQTTQQQDDRTPEDETNPLTLPQEDTEPVTNPYIELLSSRIATPAYPQLVAKPEYEDYANYETYAAARAAWADSQALQYSQPYGYADSLENYFKESIPLFLQSDGENAVCSPVNIYMALAMLAETTGGNSRQQILDLLDADSIEALRTQAGHVWNAHYRNDGTSTTLLGSSLWLDEACAYDRDVVNTLADSYYASVFWGDLGSDTVNRDLRGWLNENTRDLLTEQAQDVQLSPDTVLALATTTYYHAFWTNNGFYEGSTIADTFHSPEGDVKCDFMRKTFTEAFYYYGEDFGAVKLSLNDGGTMWLILPDEGLTPDDLLESGNALEMAMTGASETYRVRRKIHLSLPKFDVAADFSLNDSLEKLGITDVFDRFNADFSAIAPAGIDGNLYLSKVGHATRIRIDENGVEAAAYTVMPVAGDAIPPELEEINFILDRPFLFVITSQDNLPLFAGTVYQP